MKLEIKVKLFEGATLPEFIDKGEWVDLRTRIPVDMRMPQAQVQKKIVKDGQVVYRYRNVNVNNMIIPLGVAMELPEGYEAHILPRSGTYNKFGIILANSMGIIDNSYKGDNDEWKANMIALKDVHIDQWERICQFRIELSQKATIRQRIKHLFINKIEFVQVDSLNNINRGGFNSTGTK